MYWIVHHLKTDFAVPARRHRTPAGVDPSGNSRSSHYVEFGVTVSWAGTPLPRNVSGGFYST